MMATVAGLESRVEEEEVELKGELNCLRDTLNKLEAGNAHLFEDVSCGGRRGNLPRERLLGQCNLYVHRLMQLVLDVDAVTNQCVVAALHRGAAESRAGGISAGDLRLLETARGRTKPLVRRIDAVDAKVRELLGRITTGGGGAAAAVGLAVC